MTQKEIPLLKEKLFQSTNLKKSNKWIRILKNTGNYFRYKKVKRSIKGVEGKEIVANTFFDRKMNVVIPEIVSSNILLYGYYDERVMLMLLETLKPGNCFVDVGAHFGLVSLLASKLVGDGGGIYSFEPTPSTFQLLKKNVEPYKNIKIYNNAVFNNSEKIMINDFGRTLSAYNSVFSARIDSNTVKQITQHEIQAVVLDDFFNLNNMIPDVIKIDAENSEYKVLLGARETLKRHTPTIIIEVGDTDYNEKKDVPPSKTLVEFLCTMGYQAYEVRDQKIMKHTVKDVYEDNNLLFIFEK